MISNSFSWSRTTALIKRYAIENKRSLGMAAGLSFGLLLLISILITKSFSEEEYNSLDGRSFAIYMAYLWTGVIGVQILGSLTFRSLSSKARRINTLMLPAAQSEKFISNVAIYVVGGNIMLLLSMFFSDSLSALIFGMKPGWLAMPYKALFGSGTELEVVAIITFLGLWVGLFAQSLYVVGSALWPRYSFAKTFVALLALQIILPIILPLDLIGSAMTSMARCFDDWNFSETAAHVAVWGLITFLYLLLGLMYVVAWQIYRRTQVIQRFKTK